jgi:hypothetical protein
MRIQRQTFPLVLELESVTGSYIDLQISVHDETGVSTPVTCSTDNSLLLVNALVKMPGRVIIKLSHIDNNHLELRQMSLAGLKINKKILDNLAEFKANASIENIQTMPSNKTLRWDTDGCVVFDFFHPRPLAYHLLIGNKINVL